MKIIILPIPKEGPNGDRDTQRHPYFDYEIHMLKDGEAEVSPNTRVHEISGFDNWHTHIKNRDQIKSEAQEYGEKLAVRLDAELEWAGEECEVWNVSMNIIVLAKDMDHAIKIFTQRYKDQKIKPHAYQPRRFRS